MPRVTSADVARAAGVSRTTVSFVLNGQAQHGIAEDTQQLVHDAAKRLGYVPSAAARSLRAGRSNVVVCLLPDLPASEAVEVLKQELSTTLGAAGYTCAFIEAGGVTSLASLWKHITPGAVVALGALEPTDRKVLMDWNVPVLERVLLPEGAELLGFDQRMIGYRQVEHLAERGHRRIAYVGIANYRQRSFVHSRATGAADACRHLGLPEPLELTIAESTVGARAALARIINEDALITAAACFSDVVALAMLGACIIDDVAVPDRLALVGVDDTPAAALTVPALSSVALDLAVPARNLAARVAELIEDRDSVQQSAETKFRVIARDSS